MKANESEIKRHDDTFVPNFKYRKSLDIYFFVTLAKHTTSAYEPLKLLRFEAIFCIMMPHMKLVSPMSSFRRRIEESRSVSYIYFKQAMVNSGFEIH